MANWELRIEVSLFATGPSPFATFAAILRFRNRRPSCKRSGGSHVSLRECTVGRTDMSYSGSGNSGGGAWRNDGGTQPHGFDPLLQPELFRGVASRRGLVGPRG